MKQDFLQEHDSCAVLYGVRVTNIFIDRSGDPYGVEVQLKLVELHATQVR